MCHATIKKSHETDREGRRGGNATRAVNGESSNLGPGRSGVGVGKKRKAAWDYKDLGTQLGADGRRRG